MREWHVGVRATQSRKLVAFIAAIPVELRVRDKVLHSAEVNFLVVHKKLRSKRLTPVLIKEITRKCNLKEVWQAIYTAGIVLPKPVSTCRYFHRALNWQKLYEVGFSPLPTNSKPQYQVRKYALPDQTSLKGIREMQPKDLPAVGKLLNRYLKRYQLVGEYTPEEWKHWLLDKKDPGDEQVVFSYVVEVCVSPTLGTKLVLTRTRTRTRRLPTSSRTTRWSHRSSRTRSTPLYEPHTSFTTAPRSG